MRRFLLVGSGVLLLVVAVLFVYGRLTPRPVPPVATVYEPPVPRQAGVTEWEWRNPLPPFEPDPNSPFTSQEQAILRYLKRGHADRRSEREMAIEKRDKRAFVDAGGYTPDALPFYLRLLTTESGHAWGHDSAIMRHVSWIPSDRSTFRQPAVERLKHTKGSTVESAVRLLKEIGTPTEAAEVVKLIENFEFDHPGDHSYGGVAYAVLDALTAIGTEAEIKALDRAKANNFLWDNDKFWAHAEECKTAIRERLAKEKAEKK